MRPALRPLAIALALALAFAPACSLEFPPVLLVNARLGEHRLLVGELLLAHPDDLPHNRARRDHLGRLRREVLAGGQVVACYFLYASTTAALIYLCASGHVAFVGAALGASTGRANFSSSSSSSPSPWSMRPAGLTTLASRIPVNVGDRAVLVSPYNPRRRPTPSLRCCFRPTPGRRLVAPPPQHAGARQERGPTAGSVARLHGGSRRVGERVARALPGGRDTVAGGRAVCRARRRTRERGKKRPLAFL
eukprot:CAMPEP_0198680232 /NCGR_PEP_ID=MMETSP1468-20131203/4315_1 /TAXON_ID=1461545 /ORGANISM="Mantoniella sp, Strain CCMP1436" /LENGTH=248 /DNA_ID=CAMNT_0044420117 /DNA_START=154 /DNA_END=902 /DNA_ORIENTATION=-